MLDHMGIAVADFNRSKTFYASPALPRQLFWRVPSRSRWGTTSKLSVTSLSDGRRVLLDLMLWVVAIMDDESRKGIAMRRPARECNSGSVRAWRNW
jgi:hypothetical protein